jgi:hypothetical protein
MMISEQNALKGKMPKANSEYCFKWTEEETKGKTNFESNER